MIPRKIKTSLMLLLCIFLLAPGAWAGNDRLMSIMAAKTDAQRKLVETVYGFKVRSIEQVENLVASNYEGKTESKTAARIKGIKIEKVVYDREKRIAKATASVQLKRIKNIDGLEVDLKNKVFRRTGFGTTPKGDKGSIQALRAAEVDAYKQLAQQVVGFTLESKTTVENFMLKSDSIKTKVMATSYLANLIDYGWDEYGDAFVKLSLDLDEVSEMLGQRVVGAGEIIEVMGQGAQEDDYSDPPKNN
ncbi:MAG: hypothetical protein GY859_11305 [Desulfobacterales bacterium]|nr:hypothetical protein [Desulfobacterales bacterium]